MIIKNFGARVVSVWEGLRPTTKKLLVGALEIYRGKMSSPPPQKFLYDSRTDWELSRLLSVLDEQASSKKIKKDEEKLREIKQLAETCAGVLQSQTESAEVFIQLATRAVMRHDFDQIDHLANILMERFSVSEIAETIRQTTLPHIQAIGYETLILKPVSALLPLLEDPIYNEIAQNAIEQQAFEFDNEEAHAVLAMIEEEDFFDD